MGIPIFNIRQGINSICSGAVYEGSFIENTEEEYNDLVWLDSRSRPTWLEVEKATLIVLRGKICDNINERTNYAIMNEFRCSIDSSKPITASFEWQFDTLNLFMQRDSGYVEYPFELHIGTNEYSAPTYLTLKDSNDVLTVYFEMFAFINNWLTSGRIEKQKLQGLTRTGLEEYRDLR